jgi:hypothetical protein
MHASIITLNFYFYITNAVRNEANQDVHVIRKMRTVRFLIDTSYAPTQQ